MWPGVGGGGGGGGGDFSCGPPPQDNSVGSGEVWLMGLFSLYEKYLSFEIWCIWYQRFAGNLLAYFPTSSQGGLSCWCLFVVAWLAIETVVVHKVKINRPGRWQKPSPMWVEVEQIHLGAFAARMSAHAWMSAHRLSHWVLNKMAASLQTTFSNAFCWMKMIVFWLKFPRNLYLEVPFEIPHKIYYPYIERCAFYLVVKI